MVAGSSPVHPVFPFSVGSSPPFFCLLLLLSHLRSRDPCRLKDLAVQKDLMIQKDLAAFAHKGLKRV